jgi:hypothetical protein
MLQFMNLLHLMESLKLELDKKLVLKSRLFLHKVLNSISYPRDAGIAVINRH